MSVLNVFYAISDLVFSKKLAFQPNLIRKPLKQSQNIRWNYYIARSELNPANWIHLTPLNIGKYVGELSYLDEM